MSKTVLATITTYNPEIGLLEKNIDAVKGQVDKLIVYENASANRDEVLRLCEEKNAEVVCNDKNYGVAGPLHDGIDYAVENGYDYILTLDQDSVASAGMVDKLIELIKSDENLAIVAANPVPATVAESESVPVENVSVDSVYTSGMLADVGKIKSIGNYMPEMFIDWVDDEICYRAKECGYGILQSGIPLIHRLGDLQKARFLWKKIYVQNYSEFRYYHIFRNGYYCIERYGKRKDLVKRCKRRLTKAKLKVILYEKNKASKLKAMKQGKRDAEKFFADMRRKYEFAKGEADRQKR